MSMPRPALDSTLEMEPPAGEHAISVSGHPQGALDGALQQALVPDIEAEVQARLSTVLEGISDAFYSLDGDWRFSYINRAAESCFGVSRNAMLRKRIWDLFPDAAGSELRRRFEQVFALGRPLAFESGALGRPGRSLEYRVFPYDGGLGVSFRDWTEQRRAEEILRESQAQISALADNLPLGMVYQMDNGVGYEGRRFIYISASCERLNGIPAEDIPDNPQLLFDLILPEFREPVARAQMEAHAQLKPLDIKFAIRHARTGEIRWQRIVDAPRTLPGGAIVWDGIQIDITDQKRAEDHQRLLINELNHRVKNTLATVQSLAAQSFRGIKTWDAQDLLSAHASFEARLFALSRGHDILTRENWESASIAEIVGQAFAPYRGLSGDGRLHVEGPDLRVAPPAALSLSMALHELCTNAVKYGALSAPGGRVRITWAVPETATGPRLALHWEERGGPPVVAPARQGFGTRLIQDGLARELNGEVRLTYGPDGVGCAIDVPLS